jgi:hypothetical protein
MTTKKYTSPAPIYRGTLSKSKIAEASVEAIWRGVYMRGAAPLSLAHSAGFRRPLKLRKTIATVHATGEKG